MAMLNKYFFAGVLFVCIVLVSACGGERGGAVQEPAGAAKTAAADSRAQRIISAAPSNTEIVAGLGLADCLVAVDRYSRNIGGVPPGLPEIDFFYPDTEAVILLEPDIILVNEINSYGVSDNPFKLLGGLGMKVVPVVTSTSVEGIYRDIVFIAETLGVKERGEALAASVKKEVEGIAAARKDAPGFSVYFEVSAAPNMVTFGRGTYLNEMIRLAGGRNIFADEEGWFSPGAEEIIERNPDVILAMTGPGEDAVRAIKARAAFQGITALRENRVYAVDADSASRPSQHIVKAFRQIAAALNPR